MAARGADLLDRGILDMHAGPAVDQEQIAVRALQAVRAFGQHGIEHRPDAELFGAVSLQHQLR